MKRCLWIILSACLLLASNAAEAQVKTANPQTASAAQPQRRSPMESLKEIRKTGDYMDLSTIPGVKVDLKYATKDNFMGINMYGKFKTAFLHKEAAAKFKAAVKNLRKEKPGWSFIVYDSLRPRSVQWIMWDKVKDTKDKKYVANAEKGSVHNYGFALDLSLLDKKGRPLDMGTPYDTFSDLAEPQLEEKFLKEGKLTREQVDNRLVLRKVMTEAGFTQLSHEWWHYDAKPREELQKNYRIIE